MPYGHAKVELPLIMFPVRSSGLQSGTVHCSDALCLLRAHKSHIRPFQSVKFQ